MSFRAPLRPFVLGLALAAVTAAAATAGSATLVIDESSPGWGFLSENADAGKAFLHPGPGLPPLGRSSLQFAVTGDQREIFATDAFNGLYLSTVGTLSYSAWRGTPAISPLAISLQFNVDYDLTDMVDTWQGRLIFEPYLDGSTVLTGVWQTWDAIAGEWWASGTPGSDVCPQSNTCSWAEVMAAFPQIGVHATLGAVLLKAGGPWNGFFGAVDQLVIGSAGITTTFDFETNTILFANGFESGNTSAWTAAVP